MTDEEVKLFSDVGGPLEILDAIIDEERHGAMIRKAVTEARDAYKKLFRYHLNKAYPLANKPVEYHFHDIEDVRKKLEAKQ